MMELIAGGHQPSPRFHPTSPLNTSGSRTMVPRWAEMGGRCSRPGKPVAPNRRAGMDDFEAER